MPGPFTTDKTKRYQNVLNNPHIVDWYFGFRLSEFLKVVFDGILNCEWRWLRYEWQSRSTIHAHGAAKFRNDPGLRDKTANVYQGRKAEELIKKDGISEITKNKLNEIINLGKVDEKIIIDYTNTLLTAFNPRTEEQEQVVPDPHPCSIDQNEVDDRPKLYEALINCCQRHVCRPDGYCKSKKKDVKCRFHYPIEKTEATHIEFIEKGNSVKAHIYIKRNDEYLNIHNQLIFEHWLANVDMQIILDKEAAVAYMVKYATKSEKAGSSLQDLYKSVIDQATEEDSPIAKLRSLMLKNVS